MIAAIRKPALWLLCFFAGAAAISQTPDSLETRPKLVMRHADEFVITGEGRNEVYQASGNVEFVQGQARFSCSRAEYRRYAASAVFYGPVEIYDGTRTLTAARVNYNGRSGVEDAFGNVVLVSGQHRLSAEHVRYFQEAKTAEAEENVKIEDIVEYVTLFGSRGMYDITNEYGMIENNARLIKTDSSGVDSMVVTGCRMQAWSDSGLVTVHDSVRVFKDEMRAECSLLRYTSEQDSIVLSGNPIVWQEQQRLSGDTIRIVLDDMNVRKGYLAGHARIVSIDTARSDMMTGNSIRFSAETDSVRLVHVIGQATSVYYVDEGETGTNTFSGDEIFMTFHGKKLYRLVVNSDPGKSTGRFQPDTRRAAASDTTAGSGGRSE